MKRFSMISAAALLACCGLAFAQEPGPKTEPATPAKAAQPGKDKSADTTKKMNFGDAAPALSVEKWVKGEPITGFEKGKVYIVEFWATWCGPCKASMPHLSEIQKDYKSKGLTIIGMASAGWRDELGKVEDMVKDKGDTMGYTVAWDKDGATNNSYMKAARQRGIPTSFVIDQKGNIAWFGHPMRLDYVLDDIVGGKWDYKDGPAKLDKMDQEAEAIMENADGDPKAALKAMTEFEAKYPKMAKEMVHSKYSIQVRSDMWEEASKTGEIVVNEAIAKKDFMGLNEIAWQLVDPEGTVKGKHLLDLATKAATKGVELSEEKNGAIMDTLARCYWLKGDKMKAVELQKKAIASLGKDEDSMKEQLQETLKEYEGGKN